MTGPVCQDLCQVLANGSSGSPRLGGGLYWLWEGTSPAPLHAQPPEPCPELTTPQAVGRGRETPGPQLGALRVAATELTLEPGEPGGGGRAQQHPNQGEWYGLGSASVAGGQRRLSGLRLQPHPFPDVPPVCSPLHGEHSCCRANTSSIALGPLDGSRFSPGAAGKKGCSGCGWKRGLTLHSGWGAHEPGAGLCSALWTPSAWRCGAGHTAVVLLATGRVKGCCRPTLGAGPEVWTLDQVGGHRPDPSPLQRGPP